MKIKADFVTNSSSTCYVLSSVVTGNLPKLSGNYDVLKKYYPYQEALYKGYAHIKIQGDEEAAFQDLDQPVCHINLHINDCEHYDETTDLVNYKTLVRLKLDLLNPYWNEIEIVTQEFIERVLFEQLQENISPSQLMYFSYPSEISGDGWDGGDPLGPSHKYINEYDLYKAETKLAIINIMDSKLILEVTSIEQPLDFNEGLLTNINKEGFCLEEQNDKNS